MDYFSQETLDTPLANLLTEEPTSPFPSAPDASPLLPTRTAPAPDAPPAISIEPATPVLAQTTPGPPASTRFLHGGPPLSTLEAPSIVVPALASSTAVNGVSGTGTGWRAFTDEEEDRLQSAWASLSLPPTSPTATEPATITPIIVPCGLDALFSVSLPAHILRPDFWDGTPVRVLQSTWFYAPPSSSSTSKSTRASHLIKAFPVDPILEKALERAWEDVRPWDESYAAEVASALSGGDEAEDRLKVDLVLDPVVGPVLPSSKAKGVEPPVAGLEVIFVRGDMGRVYSKTVLGTMSKSVFSSTSKGFAGGQVVLRGWEAFKSYGIRKKVVREGSAGSALDSDCESEGGRTPEARSRRGSVGTPPAVATPSKAKDIGGGTGFFESLKSKLGGISAAAAAAAAAKDGDIAAGAGIKEGNDTEEAMGGPRKMRDDETEGDTEMVGEVEELILVIHGIGQKLAGAWTSLAFLHAVNQLRTNCTTLSTSPAVAPLIGGKRAQFIPIQWRQGLEFETDEEMEGEADWDNRFGLDDIEIKNSVPLLRQVVSGLVLDVPFYLSHHKEKMIKAVVRDANRIYSLFCLRNPQFVKNGGKVSIIAHSLGSALAADILSRQPTFLKDVEAEPEGEEKYFKFDTRKLILVGSPLAFFLHLGQGQLIARAGRERTKGVAKDVALDRVGRYGCMAVDSVYNVYHATDPVAFTLNATVDVAYSRLVKPIAIPSTNQTLLGNLSDTYDRVTRLFDVSKALWNTGATSFSSLTSNGSEKSERPAAGMKRMPSEKPSLTPQEFIKVSRAEKRFKALNPQGSVDYYLPSEGVNQYLEALSSHGSYWYDPRFATFVLTQLFASNEDLEKTGREEMGTEE